MAEAAAARHAVAAEMLSRADVVSHRASHHAWLKLPSGWSSEGFIREAERAGVVAWPAEKFLAAPGPVINAARLSLSNPQSIDDLRRGLSVVAALLERRPEEARDP